MKVAEVPVQLEDGIIDGVLEFVPLCVLCAAVGDGPEADDVVDETFVVEGVVCELGDDLVFTKCKIKCCPSGGWWCTHCGSGFL